MHTATTITDITYDAAPYGAMHSEPGIIPAGTVLTVISETRDSIIALYINKELSIPKKYIDGNIH